MWCSWAARGGIGRPTDRRGLAREALAPGTAQAESVLTGIRRERDGAVVAREAEERARGEAEQARQQADERIA